MNLCNANDCTGCMACYNICPVDAIKIKLNSEGFMNPVIDDRKCIKCNMCVKKCPVINPIKKLKYEDKKVFACWLEDERKRLVSTSGGAFTALAENIIRQHGVVFGVVLNDSSTVVHTFAETLKELEAMKGSKYVQSEIGDSYKRAKSYLDQGRKVLFTGTPCQIAGLYATLGKRYEDLLWTVDIVCHGVASPQIFADYLQLMQKQNGANVEKVFFRNKKPGWHVFGMKIVFDNGKIYTANVYKDPFHVGFLKNLFLRSCCYRCQYATSERIADITIADFWGYGSNGSLKERDRDKGISMVMLNSTNGKILFEQVEGLVKFIKPIEMAIKGNPTFTRSFSMPKNREEFWKDYSQKSFEFVLEKYMKPQKMKKSEVKNIILRRVPDCIYIALKKGAKLKGILGN